MTVIGKRQSAFLTFHDATGTNPPGLNMGIDADRVIAVNGHYILYLDAGVDYIDLLAMYPSVAALNPIIQIQPRASAATGLYDNTDADLAAYSFDFDPADTSKNEDFFGAGDPQFDDFPVDPGVNGLGYLTTRTAPMGYIAPPFDQWSNSYRPNDWQTGFTPAVMADTEPFPWDASFGNGIYKWQNTAWGKQEFVPSGGGGSYPGVFTTFPGVWTPYTPTVSTQFIVYSQKAWFIFMPIFDSGGSGSGPGTRHRQMTKVYAR